MHYKILLIVSFCLLSHCATNAYSAEKKGYKIEVEAPTQKGRTAYLASYWAGQTYINDSIIVPENGNFSFSSDVESLPSGQYLLFIKPEIQLELLIDEHQTDIKINIADEDYLLTSKVSGSTDTQLFWNYIRELIPLHNKIDSLANMYKNEETTEAQKIELKKQIDILSLQTTENSHKQQEKHTNSWFSKFLKYTETISGPHRIPQSLEEQRENVQYVKDHYFENIAFDDIRLWRTSFFIPQIDTYLQEWIIQHPDTIALESCKIVEKTKQDEACFENMLSYLTNKATKSSYMGMENIWAKLAEEFIFDKNLSWIKQEQYDNLKQEYAAIELNRMGMRAQNLKLRTLDGDSIETDSVEANFIVLYFYSTSCSHCQIEVPKIRKDLYPKYKDMGLKVIAINLEHDIELWKQFQEKNDLKEWINVFDPEYKSEYWLKYDTRGTPSMYLLDREKTIIAKKIDVASLSDYLEQYIK